MQAQAVKSGGQHVRRILLVPNVDAAAPLPLDSCLQAPG
jgi:hypothetical protein